MVARLLALALLLPACSSSRGVVVRLGIQRVGPYRAFFVADEKGLFRDEGVRVEAVELGSSNVIGQALLAGRLDGSGFVSFPVLFAMERDAPGQSSCELVLPMTARSRFSAIVVPASSTVTRPEELRGGRLAVHPSATNVVYARMMLERLFGSADAAELVEVEPATQLSLLERGAVDAVIGPDPMPAVAVARGIGRVLVYAPDARWVADPLPVGCATLSRAFVERHPAEAGAVRRALERAVDYLRDPAHRAEVDALVARRTGVEPAIAGGLGEVDYWKLPEVDRPSLQRLADLLAREHVLAGRVDAAALVPPP